MSGQGRPVVGRPPAWRLAPREEIELAGGLGVTLVPVGAVPKATLRLVTGAGAALEAPGETWLSRLLARYLKEGTAARDAAALADHVAGLGGELDVDADDDSLWLEVRVLSEFAPEAVELLAEVVRTPALPEEALPRLRADLGRQLELARSEPGWLTLERFRGALYGAHPYGRVLADAAEIESFSLASVRAFLERAVGAAGSRLYVAGSFDAEAVGRAASRALGGWGDAPGGEGSGSGSGLRTDDSPRRPPRCPAVDDPDRPPSARPRAPRLRAADGCRCAAGGLLHVADHDQHPRAEGLHLLAAEQHRRAPRRLLLA